MFVRVDKKKQFYKRQQNKFSRAAGWVAAARKNIVLRGYTPCIVMGV